jgi:Leucine-rich repeat (LRR) protein
VNAYCEDYQTPLHVAVKQRSHAIATMLLTAKADPNIPILPSPSSVSGSFGHHSHNTHHHPSNVELQRKHRKEESSTALVEACLQRDLGMIELLLKFGARDDECKAVAIVCRDDVIVGKILAVKAHQDSENKINVSYMNEYIVQKLKKPLLASSVLPTSPVNINWHNQKLDHISEQWLISATLRINPRLRLCPKNQNLGLQAITKLDLSTNSLEKLPQTIWSLCSLRYLNLSHNKIEILEMSQSNSSAPLLEEILLQENQLESVPDELFTMFPSLNSLNLSNNKLQSIPSAVWTSPKLQELNLSLNLLTEMPALSSGMEMSMFDSLPYLSLANSPEEEGPKSPDFVMVDFAKNREKLCRISVSSQDSAGHNLSSQNPHPVLTHHALWRQNVHVVTNQELSQKSSYSESSSLIALNLAHNSFHKIPKVLACLAPNLQRLNLSYNNLKFMGHIAEYPVGLRQLDLSHNQIERWFYSPGEKVNVKLSCYGPVVMWESGSDIGNNVGCERCIHKRHTRLDNLKTLLLSGNVLKGISVQGEDNTVGNTLDDSQSETLMDSVGRTPNQGKNLWFPGVTMIDISDNMLKEVPPKVAELSNLSVLNISGNSEISDLPPEMGLLNRMWNLNTTGCNLQEPLKSMIESKRCKTMDIIGYLKSVLEDAKTYSRMKLMVVGIQGIGKTSLLHQLRQEGSQKHASQDVSLTALSCTDRLVWIRL